MLGRSFLDTNILIYCFDKNVDFRFKAENLLRQLYQSEDCFISSQVVVEFCRAAQQKLNPPLSMAAIRDFINTLPTARTVLVTIPIIEHATILQEKYRLSFWDSVIISAALSIGCEKLYTQDMQSGQLIENQLLIINPFVN